MATVVREVERKYEAGAEIGLPDLSGLPEITVRVDPDEQVLDALYYDTADLRLAATGITLRRRTGGSDAGWHLKLPAGPDSRDELRLPVGEQGDPVPPELVERVLVHSREADLVPVAQLRTTRRRALLLDAGERTLAELVVDRVSAQALGETATSTRWQEVEVELVEGDQDLLDAVEARLAEQGIQPAAAGSKLARLLGDRIPERPGYRPTSLSPKSTAGEVVGGYLTAQIERIKRYDPLVRRNEPDAVHQMRVSIRSTRAAMRTFRGVVPAQRARALNVELRWFAGVLGRARDAEVQSEMVTGQARELPEDLLLGPVVTWTEAHFDAEHGDALREVAADMRGERYFALLDGLDAFLADGLDTATARRRADRVLPGMVRRTYTTLRDAIRAVDGTTGEARDVALHEARKAVKRSRYAAELVAPALGDGPRDYAKRIKKLQTALGDHQDSVVARKILRTLGEQAHAAGHNGFSYGVLHARNAAWATDIERGLDRLWRKASARRFRRWMR